MSTTYSRFFAVVASMMTVAPALAVNCLFHGGWTGGDRAAAAIYGVLRVSTSTLSWGGHDRFHPACRVGYRQVDEPPGVSFPDQLGNTHVTGPDAPFDTVLLRLTGAGCASPVAYLRLTRWQRPDGDTLAIVEYTEDRRAIGMMHFFR
jgi:hypothetical protein